jgi:hypothetical protein
MAVVGVGVEVGVGAGVGIEGSSLFVREVVVRSNVDTALTSSSSSFSKISPAGVRGDGGITVTFG